MFLNICRRFNIVVVTFSSPAPICRRTSSRVVPFYFTQRNNNKRIHNIYTIIYFRNLVSNYFSSLLITKYLSRQICYIPDNYLTISATEVTPLCPCCVREAASIIRSRDKKIVFSSTTNNSA